MVQNLEKNRSNLVSGRSDLVLTPKWPKYGFRQKYWFFIGWKNGLTSDWHLYIRSDIKRPAEFKKVTYKIFWPLDDPQNRQKMAFARQLQSAAARARREHRRHKQLAWSYSLNTNLECILRFLSKNAWVRYSAYLKQNFWTSINRVWDNLQTRVTTQNDRLDVFLQQIEIWHLDNESYLKIKGVMLQVSKNLNK